MQTAQAWDVMRGKGGKGIVSNALVYIPVEEDTYQRFWFRFHDLKLEPAKVESWVSVQLI